MVAAISEEGGSGSADGETAAAAAAAAAITGGGDDGGGGAKWGDPPAYEDAVAAVASASLVAGLHPDQAASEIVAFAAARRLPFAVVPCCVYAREFPFRRVPAAATPEQQQQQQQQSGVGGGDGSDLFSSIAYARYLRGKKVKSYDDLVDWLVATGPEGTKTTVLPFEGKNVCVYWTGDK